MNFVMQFCLSPRIILCIFAFIEITWCRSTAREAIYFIVGMFKYFYAKKNKNVYP